MAFMEMLLLVVEERQIHFMKEEQKQEQKQEKHLHLEVMLLY